MSDAVPQGSSLGRALQKMTDRERKLVIVMIVAVALFAFAAVSMGVSSFIASREKRIRLHKDEIAQIETLRTAYDAAAAREKAADARIQSASTTSLFTLLQKSAGELGLALSDLNERRLPVKDSELTEVTVDVNLKEISVDKLVTLLEKIEGRSSDGVVKVSKLKVKTRFDNPEMLEASLTVSTWKAPSGGAGGVGGAEGTKP
jgi:general secretion pathway protein M